MSRRRGSLNYPSARSATSWSSLHRRIRFGPLLLAAEKRSLVSAVSKSGIRFCVRPRSKRASHGPEDPGRGSRIAAAEIGARGTQRAGAVLCVVGARPRSRREFYRLPKTNLGEFWLGPRPGGLGLFAERAGRRGGGAAGGPAVRPRRRPHRLCAGTVIAWRGVPDRRLRAASLAVPVKPRPVRRSRHRLHRQRSEFHPARPLVRPAAADRDGGRVFGDRRRRGDPAAAVAGPDRSCRPPRLLSDLRRPRPASAAAAVGLALAPVLHPLAPSPPKRRPR